MKRLIVLFALAFTLFAVAPAHAKSPIHTGWLSNTAVDGYDVVAYFEQGKPVEGSAEFATEWKGAEWRFASAEHLEAFKADPERYAPKYGGYCAWAVAQDKTAAGDPRHWSIVDGDLYLNYNADIQADWEANRAAFIVEADRNWPGVIE